MFESDPDPVAPFEAYPQHETVESELWIKHIEYSPDVSLDAPEVSYPTMLIGVELYVPTAPPSPKQP